MLRNDLGRSCHLIVFLLSIERTWAMVGDVVSERLRLFCWMAAPGMQDLVGMKLDPSNYATNWALFFKHVGKILLLSHCYNFFGRISRNPVDSSVYNPPPRILYPPSSTSHPSQTGQLLQPDQFSQYYSDQ